MNIFHQILIPFVKNKMYFCVKNELNNLTFIEVTQIKLNSAIISQK